MLVNVSTRGVVGEGDDVMIGGFIVTGTEAKQVLLRAIGPLPDHSLPWRGSCSIRGMTIVAALFTLLSCSAFFMVSALRRAPEGYEDEKGFHLTNPLGATKSLPSESRFLPELPRKVA